MSQRSGDSRPDALDMGGAENGLSDNRETFGGPEAGRTAAAAAMTTRTASLTGTALATAVGMAVDATQVTGQVSDMTLAPKVNFSAVTSTAFDRWLARELRAIATALAQPVPQKLLDLIEGHRKITK